MSVDRKSLYEFYMPQVIAALQREADLRKNDVLRGYVFEVEEIIRFNAYFEGAKIALIFLCHSPEEAIIKIHTHLAANSSGKFNYLERTLNYFLDQNEDEGVQYTINIQRFIDDMIFDPVFVKFPNHDSYWIRVMELVH